MARPRLTTVEAVARLLGQDITNTDQAEAFIEIASEVVRAFAKQTWLNEAEDALEGVPAQIPGVVDRMVVRAIRNPDEVTQEQAGPFTRSMRPVYMDQYDKMVVRSAVGSSGVGVLSTTRGDLETPAVSIPGAPLPEETLAGLADRMGGT